MKKFLSVLISIIIAASVFAFGVSAANSTIIAFSANTVTIGDKVTVTLTLNSDQPIWSYDYKLSYDSTKLNYQGAAGVIHDANAANGENKLSFSFTFDSIAVGSVAIKAYDCIVSPDGTNEINLGGASATLTVKDVALSNNSNLKALSLSAGNLSPTFNANRTNYTASVPYETNSIRVYATASDTNAKVNVQNPTALNVGQNTINVTVTAADGSQKIYKIVVTRREQGADDTSQPETSTPENTNPYETVISGKSYEVVTSIPETAILKGFTLSTADYNGTQVPVIRDSNNEFTVYYLKESGAEAIAPYTYNAELKAFEELKYKTLNDLVYIFTDFPQDVTMPNDYYSSFTQIGDYSVKSYLSTNSQMSDFAYVYCFVNGDSGLYRYDSKEGTLQRYPDVILVYATDATVPEKDSFANRFATLSTNGKVLLIAMLIAAICVVVLIVFLIIMAINKFKGNDDLNLDAEDEFDFDDVTVVGEEDKKE